MLTGDRLPDPLNTSLPHETEVNTLQCSQTDIRIRHGSREVVDDGCDVRVRGLLPLDLFLGENSHFARNLVSDSVHPEVRTKASPSSLTGLARIDEVTA